MQEYSCKISSSQKDLEDWTVKDLLISKSHGGHSKMYSF